MLHSPGRDPQINVSPFVVLLPYPTPNCSMSDRTTKLVMLDMSNSRTASVPSGVVVETGLSNLGTETFSIGIEVGVVAHDASLDPPTVRHDNSEFGSCFRH